MYRLPDEGFGILVSVAFGHSVVVGEELMHRPYFAIDKVEKGVDPKRDDQELL